MSYIYLEKGPTRRGPIHLTGGKGMPTKVYFRTLVKLGFLIEKEGTCPLSKNAENQFLEGNLGWINWFKYSGSQNSDWRDLKNPLSQSGGKETLQPAVLEKGYRDYLAHTEPSKVRRRPLYGQSGIGTVSNKQASSILGIGNSHGLVSPRKCFLKGGMRQQTTC